MTVKELMNEVAALGFEKEIELDGAFSSAATRAIRQIYSDRAVPATLKIIHQRQAPTLYYKMLVHESSRPLSVLLDGRAYVFKVSGKGSFSVAGAEHHFDTRAGVFRGFCEKGDVITFEGDYLYTVHDLTVYSERVSDRADDIYAPGEDASYDLSLMTNDFLAFRGAPTDRYGKTISAARFEGSILYLPSTVTGEITVKYRKAPMAILPYDESAAITISAETEHMLPLLTAAYLWLDDDRDKAEYYMQLYRSEMASLRRYVSVAHGAQYETPNGWA